MKRKAKITDKERLDWLERQGQKSLGWAIIRVGSTDQGFGLVRPITADRFKTARQCIDAAMSKEKS